MVEIGLDDSIERGAVEDGSSRALRSITVRTPKSAGKDPRRRLHDALHNSFQAFLGLDAFDTGCCLRADPPTADEIETAAHRRDWRRAHE